MPSAHPFGFYVFTWVLSLVAVGILTVGLISDPEAVSRNAWVLSEWTLLVALADWVSVPVGRGIEIGVDLPLLLAAAYLWGPFAAGAVALIGSTDRREWRCQVTPTNALFSHSQVSISVIAAGLVFVEAGGRNARWPSLLLPGLLGLLADIAVNMALVVVGTALKRGTTWSDILGSMRFGSRSQSVITYAAYGSLAIVLTGAYREAGAWALAEFAVPLLLARQAILQTTELRRKQRALNNVTLQILKERQDERTRIASALHDDVQQALYNVTLRTEVVREELRSGRLLALEDDIPALLQASQRTRSLLREVIRGLRRSNLGVGGLSATLLSLVDDLSSTWKGRIECHIEEVDGPPEIQLLVYQIGREALLNAVRHSNASLIEVRLFLESERICLVVADDGLGFLPEVVDVDQHFGVEIMKERARLAGGQLELRSRPQLGTQVIGRFPNENRLPG